MAAANPHRQRLLARIDALLKEAYALPRSTESWERRLYIDGELFQLFRRLADADAEAPTPDDRPDEHPHRPRRHDRPARFLSS